MLVLAGAHEPVEELGLLVVRPVFSALRRIVCVGVRGGVVGVPSSFLLLLQSHRRVRRWLALQGHLWRRRASEGRAAGVDMLLVGVMGVYWGRRRGYSVLGWAVVGGWGQMISQSLS